MSNFINFWTRGGMPVNNQTIDFYYHTHSDLNNFIPFYAGFIGRRIKNNRTGKSLLTYNIPSPTDEVYKQRWRYDNIISSLEYSTTPVPYYRKTTGYTYGIMKGLVTYNEEVLMCLCVDNNSFWGLKSKKAIDYSNFYLIVNNKFKTTEHKALFNQINRRYIEGLSQVGVDVINTSNVLKYCLNSVVTLPKLSNIAETIKHYKDLNKLILTDE